MAARTRPVTREKRRRRLRPDDQDLRTTGKRLIPLNATDIRRDLGFLHQVTGCLSVFVKRASIKYQRETLDIRHQTILRGFK